LTISGNGSANAPAGGAGGHVPSLVMRDVVVAYDHAPVVEGVTGSVEPGSAVALIGPNGAGKSTLLKAILGLVDVAGGSITVLGKTPAAARGEVAYVPQADTLDAEFPVSALQVVLMGRYRRVGWLRRPGRADRAVAADALDLVGLGGAARARFGTLSGGQRQRVLLARAIAQQARLLLLDEPFNGVDAVSQDRLLSALAELRAGGASVVMSTHDLALAHLACDEACLLNRHQFAFGPVETTLTPELLRATYGANALDLRGDGVILLQQDAAPSAPEYVPAHGSSARGAAHGSGAHGSAARTARPSAPVKASAPSERAGEQHRRRP
jgi:manganese/iron transport system ATP-binding protein